MLSIGKNQFFHCYFNPLSTSSRNLQESILTNSHDVDNHDQINYIQYIMLSIGKNQFFHCYF